MPRRDDPDRKNLILLFYVAAFALLGAALYFFRGEGGFVHGTVEILVILLFPLGALAYGYVTGDRVRSVLAAFPRLPGFTSLWFLFTKVIKRSIISHGDAWGMVA